ncbi:phosphotransferase [Solwaraspora sp. WMMD406]|uniref:phosphotransferase n=1 Tax=Solwaraspora sp. WMMD406 TaxID=3016095 RepID=UPI002416B377|nr:phosphotransferase [Solwaraspora sp. WMMD406]MDG4765052.1 phosphotransferase [Solwaraspora sp. WMMD406]
MLTADESILGGNDWADPAWRDGVLQWVGEQLAARGTPAVGPVEQERVRPWSVTYRAPTAAGWHWFKANTYGCRYEAPLAAALAGWVPDAVLAPIATHPVRGWLLTADAGATLRDALGRRRGGADAPRDADAELPHWVALLEQYADLQRTVAPHAEAMVALGVPDQRSDRLPALLADLLDDPAVRAGLGPERAAAVAAKAPDVARWCAELAADGMPASLQHDDLHDGNVFVADGGYVTSGDAMAPYRFFDWGDASVAHPFGTLLVTLSSASYAYRLAPGDPWLARLRDAYLSGWPGDGAARRRSAALACRLTRISRALSWRRALDRAASPIDDDVRDAPAEWLAELSEPDIV